MSVGDIAHPAFSADGNWIAFAAHESGDNEVYCVAAAGGPPHRLTYLGIDRVLGWTPAGEVCATSAVGQPFYRPSGRHGGDHTWAHSVPLDGGPPERLPYGPVSALGFGSGGAMVLGRNGGDPAWWKRYRGGHHGPDLGSPHERRPVAAPAPRPSGQPGLSHAGGRADLLPLGPPGHGQRVLGRPRGFGAATAHPPRRLLRPVGVNRRRADRVPTGSRRLGAPDGHRRGGAPRDRPERTAPPAVPSAGRGRAPSRGVLAQSRGSFPRVGGPGETGDAAAVRRCGAPARPPPGGPVPSGAVVRPGRHGGGAVRRGR